jgi:hypothetical protein
MSGEHKLKEGDEIVFSTESHNTVELLFFSNKLLNEDVVFRAPPDAAERAL